MPTSAKKPTTSEDALQEVASQMKGKLTLTEDEVRNLIAQYTSRHT